MYKFLKNVSASGDNSSPRHFRPSDPGTPRPFIIRNTPMTAAGNIYTIKINPLGRLRQFGKERIGVERPVLLQAFTIFIRRPDLRGTALHNDTVRPSVCLSVCGRSFFYGQYLENKAI